MVVEKEYIFVFIEPVNHGYKVVLAAKQMGFKLAVVHQMDLFAPKPYQAALDAFDIDIPIDSWLDHDQLHSLLDRELDGHSIIGTYAGAEITLPFDASLRQKANLPGTPVEVINFCLNKFNARDLICREGLSKLHYLSKQEILALDHWPFERPMYFKPSHGGGSVKVFRCESFKDLQHAIDSWNDKDDVHVSFLREYLELYDDYLLEEAAQGELISVESFVYDGKVNVLGISSRTVLKRDTSVEMGATFPYRQSFEQAVNEKVEQLHQALGIVHGPTHTEVMVSDDGEVELIELNLRFAGADVLEICCRAYETNIAESLVRLGCGQDPCLPKSSANRFATLQYILAPSTIKRFDSIEFPDEVDFYREQKPLGSDLVSTDYQIDHVGCFIMAGDDYHSLMHAADKVRHDIKINDVTIGADVNNIVIQR